MSTTSLPFSGSLEIDRTNLAARETRLLKWCALLALALGSAWPLTLNLVDPDLWGHVRYAQDWLTDGELPQTATHTFTAEGHPWVNHEILAELALALGYESWGVNGLLLAKCLLGMSIIGAMVWVATRRGVNSLVAWGWMMVITANLQAFFPLRPQLLSFVNCAAVLVVLETAFATWHPERSVRQGLLWLLPLVVIVWTNSHGGFVAGLAILGAYLGGRILELVVDVALRRTGFRWGTALNLALVGLACLAVTLVNPYGFELWKWLLFSMSQPRPEITEWLPPHPGDAVFKQWAVMLTIGGASLLATRQRRDWVKIAILALVVWQATLHLRHIAFVALLAGFWIPPHLQSALGRLRPDRANQASSGVIQSAWIRRPTILALLALIVLQSLMVDLRLRTLPVERSRFPVDALQYMADRHLGGKLVVSFNWAQYCIAALAPQIRVAFDGRFYTCYPPEVVDMHFDFLVGEAAGKRHRHPESGPLDGTRVLRYRNPDLVLIDRHYKHPAAIMKAEALKENPEWTLLYCDQVAELWGRTDRYDDPVSSDYIPTRQRARDPSPPSGSLTWPALPTPASTEAGQQLASDNHTGGPDSDSL